MQSNITTLSHFNVLGLQRASDLLLTPKRTPRPKQNTAISKRTSYPALEITLGVDPKDLVASAVQKVSDGGLQDFIHQVVHEPEVLPLLVRSINTDRKYQRHVIQSLRAAGETAQYWSAMGREEGEVLYVATFVLGIQTLLSELIVGNATPRDVMFTIARPYLYRLEEASPRCASLLRQCLGWCPEDEVDGEYVPRLQLAVQRAVLGLGNYGMGRSAITQSSAFLPT